MQAPMNRLTAPLSPSSSSTSIRAIEAARCILGSTSSSQSPTFRRRLSQPLACMAPQARYSGSNGSSGRRRALSTSTSQQQLLTHSSSPNSARYIRIVEVSPRDGLQNLPPPAVPTKLKKELVQRLLDAGVTNIEVGSFVRGDRVPQMADTPILLPQLLDLNKAHDSIHYPVLVPNMRGLDNLLKLEQESGGQRLTDEIAVFVSATEAFSKANNSASVEKVMSALPEVIVKAKSHGYRVRGYVSCVMADPYSGPTPPEQVVDVAAKLLEMGCYEVSLGDTTGEGNPQAWEKLWDTLKARGLPLEKVAAHCHDTFSMALSSIIALLPRGLKSVDSSLAGLGGCPYSPGATGNVPTEDVVYALHTLGYDTGINLEKLVEAGNWLSETLGVRNESRVGRAMWARRKAKEAAAAAT